MTSASPSTSAVALASSSTSAVAIADVQNHPNRQLDSDSDSDFDLDANENVNDNDVVMANELQPHDPATWPSYITTTMIDFILDAGALPRADHYDRYEFPKTDSRGFPKSAFAKKMDNGSSIARSWLIYSKTADAAYCFCCAIFQRDKCGALSSVGTRDWKHLYTILDSHAGSRNHVLAFSQWKERDARFRTGTTIDAHQQKLLNAEKERWGKVFFRIVECVKYLAKQNIAFCGANQRVNDSSNGNFMQLIQTIATFDDVMAEHLRIADQSRISNERTIHYLSSDIQNDVIAALASAISDVITKQIKESKYYAIIADCTPDVSHREQMSLIIRCVQYCEATSQFTIVERFVKFQVIEDKSGQGIADVLLEMLARIGLSTLKI